MYILVPDEPHVGFVVVAVIFVSATLLGFASHSPGGLGVFDAAMLVGPVAVRPGRTAGRDAAVPGALLSRAVRYFVILTLASGAYCRSRAKRVAAACAAARRCRRSRTATQGSLEGSRSSVADRRASVRAQRRTAHDDDISEFRLRAMVRSAAAVGDHPDRDGAWSRGVGDLRRPDIAAGRAGVSGASRARRWCRGICINPFRRPMI